MKILGCLLIGFALAIGWLVIQRTSEQERVRTKQEIATAAKASVDIQILTTYLHEHAQAHGVRGSLEELIQQGATDYVPTDPWGHEYVVRWQVGTNNAIISSRGPDGIANTRDDIFNQ